MISFLWILPAKGSDRHPFFTSARTQSMGGAYIGLADDENAVFLNPAGLAGIKDVSFYYANLETEASGDIISAYQTSKSAFSKFNAQSIDAIMGDNIYARGTFSSIFQMPHFALGVIADGQVAFDVRNKALPQVEFGYQATNGIQAGFGMSFSESHRHGGQASELRLGFAPKILYRRGGYYLMQTTDLLQIDQGKALLNRTVGEYGLGFGLDLGAQYIFPMSKMWNLSAGISYRDVGNTSFSSPQASPIRSDLGFGFASKFEISLMKINVAYDYTNLLDSMDWRLRNHFGTEFVFPLLSVDLGLNQVYLTYGVSVDVWVVKVSLVSYGQEMGAFAHQDPTRRYIMRLSLKLDF